MTWVTNPIPIESGQAYEVEATGRFRSESESVNTIRHAVMRAGPDPAAVEDDFPQIGVNSTDFGETPYGGLREPLRLRDGWREYALERTTPELSTDALHLAVGTAVTNRMSNERLRISYVFGVGYGDDLGTATDILLSVADDAETIPDDPEPSVRVTDPADNAVLLQSRFRISDPDREDFSATRSTYVREVKERCERAGIDLSTTSQHELSGSLAVDDVPSA